ncbi:triose-phosphate isomerase [Devosia sp.]|uniref:triose-phosphate isomerase n=1 Tax=Devosia sp. TaxID=1871048 RepID=UPI003BACB4CC
MAREITPLVAGNWKMNGTGAALAEVSKLAAKLSEGSGPNCTVVICPPATLLDRLSKAASGTAILSGGQDCHPALNGAHTGDISAQMLADAGARYVIVGHSERRANHAETDELVRRKAEAALAAGLIPIICVGETEAERRGGIADAVVATQLEGSVPDQWSDFGIVIAYEPIWAIGTGLTPTIADIAEMHDGIRALLLKRFADRGEAVQLLYGGSMKPANAADILKVQNVNGGLVGGASLLANDFHAIISAA